VHHPATSKNAMPLKRVRAKGSRKETKSGARGEEQMRKHSKCRDECGTRLGGGVGGSLGPLPRRSLRPLAHYRTERLPFCVVSRRARVSIPHCSPLDPSRCSRVPFYCNSPQQGRPPWLSVVAYPRPTSGDAKPPHGRAAAQPNAHPSIQFTAQPPRRSRPPT